MKKLPAKVPVISIAIVFIGVVAVIVIPMYLKQQPQNTKADTASQPQTYSSVPTKRDLAIANHAQDSATEPDNLRRVADDHRFGCVDKHYLERLIQYASDRDIAAFNGQLSAGILAGECTMFRGGEEVFLEDATWTGLVQVRRRGETVAYWTTSESLQ